MLQRAKDEIQSHNFNNEMRDSKIITKQADRTLDNSLLMKRE